MQNPNIGDKGVFWGLEAAGINSDDHKKSTCPACSSDRRKSEQKCLNITPSTTKTGGGAWTIFCHHCGWGEGVLILDDSDWRNIEERNRMNANAEKAPYQPQAQRVIQKMPEKVYKLPKPAVPTQSYSVEFIEFWAKRGISRDTLILANVGEQLFYMPELQRNELAARFPVEYNGQILSYKYRAIRHKTFAIESGTELVLIGAQALAEAKKRGTKVDCIIVEGEVDYLTVLELKIASIDGSGGRIVVSVPNGTNSLGCLKKHFDNKDFDIVDRFLLFTDADPAGVKMRDELTRRLGLEKCVYFDYPAGCKDINDVHVNFLCATSANVWQCVKEKVPPLQGIDTVNDVWDGIMTIRSLGNPQYKRTGIKDLDELFTWHLGAQLTALSAPPNSGKTDFILSVAVRLAHLHGAKVGIMSPETGSSAEIYDALVRCYLGKLTSRNDANTQPKIANQLGIASDEEFNAAICFVREHFFVYSCEEPTMRTAQMLQIAEGLVKRHGINMLICDPYNFLEDAFSDPENSREMMANYINSNLQRIKHWTQKNNVHVVVVPHPKALAPYEPMSDFGQINGGAAWGNKCDNVIFLNRLFSDKGSQERMDRAAKCQDDTYDETLGDKVEVVIRKVKKRYAGKIGTAALAYRMPTGQFGDAANDMNRRAAEFLNIKTDSSPSYTALDGEDHLPF